MFPPCAATFILLNGILLCQVPSHVRLTGIIMEILFSNVTVLCRHYLLYHTAFLFNTSTMLHPSSHESLLNFPFHFENCICIVKLSDNNNLESLSMDYRICIFAFFVFLIDFNKPMFQDYTIGIFSSRTIIDIRLNIKIVDIPVKCAFIAESKRSFLFSFLEPRQCSIEFIRIFSTIVTLCLN